MRRRAPPGASAASRRARSASRPKKRESSSGRLAPWTRSVLTGERASSPDPSASKMRSGVGAPASRCIPRSTSRRPGSRLRRRSTAAASEQRTCPSRAARTSAPARSLGAVPSPVSSAMRAVRRLWTSAHASASVGRANPAASEPSGALTSSPECARTLARSSGLAGTAARSVKVPGASVLGVAGAGAPFGTTGGGAAPDERRSISLASARVALEGDVPSSFSSAPSSSARTRSAPAGSPAAARSAMSSRLASSERGSAATARRAASRAPARSPRRESSVASARAAETNAPASRVRSGATQSWKCPGRSSPR